MRACAPITAASLASIALACLLSLPALADEYRLAAGDHLNLKVLEWRADRGEPYEWPGLAGDYIVGVNGALALPIVGFVAAEDRTISQLAQQIGQSLQKETGLAHSLQVSLQVSQYRPCYVLGDVEKPGEFPFRPNLTVLEAVSLAGGIYRGAQNQLQLERQAIEARGAERGFAFERVSLLAAEARLNAEAKDLTSVAFSDELNGAGDERSASAKSVQVALFQSRQVALRTRLEGLEETKRLLGAEIQTLTDKKQNLVLQLDLNKFELGNISTLMKKGLTTEPRKIALQENLQQLESTKLDYELSIIRAQQGIATAERDKGDAVTARKSEVLTDLATIETKIAQNEAARATAVRLAEQVEAKMTPNHAATRGGSRVYAVERKGLDQPQLVSETDSLQPGDVLKVSEKLSNGLSN